MESDELVILGQKIDGKNFGGVGFMIHPRVQPSIHSHEILSPRIAVLRLRTTKNATITIVNCYAPNSVASEEDKDNFYTELEATVKKEKSYYKYICGDFNALVGNGSDGNWRLGRHGNEARNDDGLRLLDLMSSCNLFHGNSIFEKPQHRRWTWESPNGQTHSELDHVLTNRRWSLMDTTVLPSFDSGSDHRLLRAKIRLNDRIFKRDRHRGPPVRSPEYDEQELQKAMDMYPWRKIEDPTADYDELAKGLAFCAKAAMTNHKQREERLNEKAKQLLRRRGEVRRDPAATHFEKVVINKACRIAMKESLREHRKSKLLSTAVQRKSLERCRRELTDYSAVTTCLKDKDETPKTARTEIERIVTEFYTNLYRSTTDVPRRPSPTEEKPPNILVSEVRNAIQSLKKGTAPGPDGITADLLRVGGYTMHKLLAEHFTSYLEAGVIPKQWKCSRTVLIFKKGDKEEIENYRPIALLSIPYKVFTAIILNRLEGMLDAYQPTEQAGFRKGFCCMDHIHTIIQLIERCREYTMPLILTFVDYRKAFDSADTNAVLNALIHAEWTQPT
ncbi:hypothetical protein Y032_0051g2083 [Ancylostoma ceylanicum]|uniref:Reverse transcriptase domain-containing protein n=1 Tax=Ancylostoma ceylanicum TaxID=53326 RepID=A0A016U9D0_9BILA|nr:hypothetical protein Y032_0051g2083 [Ancylostoma ceylanicum]